MAVTFIWWVPVWKRLQTIWNKASTHAQQHFFPITPNNLQRRAQQKREQQHERGSADKHHHDVHETCSGSSQSISKGHLNWHEPCKEPSQPSPSIEVTFTIIYSVRMIQLAGYRAVHSPPTKETGVWDMDCDTAWIIPESFLKKHFCNG